MLRLIDRAAIAWMNWRRRMIVNRNPEMGTFKIHEIIANKNGVNIIAESESVVWIAGELVRLLDAAQAKNYVQMDMMPSMDVADKPVRITVQWAHGESPAMRAERLERELKNLKQKGGEEQ